MNLDDKKFDEDEVEIERTNLLAAAKESRLVIGIIVLLGILWWWSDQRDAWQGVYYPNGCLVCESDYIYSPVFETKEECLDWADGLWQSRQNPNDDFECGKNCKSQDGFQVCEETTDA